MNDPEAELRGILLIKTVDINERGNGKLTVYGENLQKGIYTYSLIADGKLIATKKNGEAIIFFVTKNKVLFLL